MHTPIRSEHPRPDRQRAHWQTLNGLWGFAFDPEKRGQREAWYSQREYPLQIEVPFCYQSPLSGIAGEEDCDVVWYQRAFTLEEALQGDRVLLHFGAVDYLAQVWLDGQFLGAHEGGYTPFSFDITDAVQGGGTHLLTVRCEDRLDTWQPRGKQSYRPEAFACWYTPVTGIWQSVWLEGVGDVYPTDLRITPQINTGTAEVELMLNACPPDTSVRLTVTYQGQPVLRQEVSTHQRLVKTALQLGHNEEINGVH